MSDTTGHFRLRRPHDGPKCLIKEDGGGIAAPILLSIYKRTVIAREEVRRPKQPPPPSEPFPPTEEALRSKQPPAIYSLFTTHYPLIFFEQIPTQGCGFGRVETYGRTSLRPAGTHFYGPTQFPGCIGMFSVFFATPLTAPFFLVHGFGRRVVVSVG